MTEAKKGLVWRTYCTTCRKELYADRNGQFAEAYARMHVEGTQVPTQDEMLKAHPDHKVLVGYEYEREED